MAEPNRQKIPSEWAARGFSCDLWTDPPGQRWEDFRHATDELVTVLEGEMEFEVAGKVHHPQIGDELLIPAGTMHSAWYIGKATAKWLFVLADLEKDGDLAEIMPAQTLFGGREWYLK
jgi:quercetin dioxygenase-like cupin family protein